MTGLDPVPWRDGLAAISDPAVTGVLTVQCGLGWLRPEVFELRDEIDSAIAGAMLVRVDLAVDRIVLHSLPIVGDLVPGEVAALNAAHADWLYRLAAAGALLPQAGRPRVHRLIVRGSQRSVDLVDGIQLRRRGEWGDPDTATAAWDLTRSGATTPLTSYDIDMDGAFGDSDPSVYL